MQYFKCLYMPLAAALVMQLLMMAFEEITFMVWPLLLGYFIAIGWSGFRIAKLGKYGWFKILLGGPAIYVVSSLFAGIVASIDLSIDGQPSLSSLYIIYWATLINTSVYVFPIVFLVTAVGGLVARKRLT